MRKIEIKWVTRCFLRTVLQLFLATFHTDTQMKATVTEGYRSRDRERDQYPTTIAQLSLPAGDYQSLRIYTLAGLPTVILLICSVLWLI